MRYIYKQFFITLLLITHLSLTRAQFSETIFHDSLTKVTNDGYIHSGIAEGKFIYLSGSSFSEQSPLPTITKTDTAGNVIWTVADNENHERFGDYFGWENSMAACKSTFKSGSQLYTIAQGVGTQANTYNEIWCISDSGGVIVWKTIINEYVYKIVDYSTTELLLLTNFNGYNYHIINKITGKLVFSKFIAFPGVSLQNEPNILVDAQKNILISWDDICQKYRDKLLTQLLWTSILPNNGSLRMIDMVIQDSARYLIAGNNYARAIDSLTGNTIWYRPVQVGYIQGTQSGDDGNPKAIIVKDSSLYITWVSPYVGNVDLERGFTLTRINTANGSIRFNVAYDFIGAPADLPPPAPGGLDWPIAMSIDANKQIYLSGSYDRGPGAQSPGNWGIMKINGATGAKMYESTITEDSTRRMERSQGRFLYYFNGKMYCAGNTQKRQSISYARPLMLSFDTASTYNEKFRIYPEFVCRYPSSLVTIAPFSNQKMVLLKKLGQSSIIELRNTNNQLIWSKNFNSDGKYVVPQNLINLADTGFAASFIFYTKNTRYKAIVGLPDSILMVRLDTSGTIAYQRKIAVSNTDTILPVQIYSDKFGKINFIYLVKGSGQRFENRSFMLNSAATSFGYIGASEYYTYKEIPKMNLQRLQHYFGDTSVIYFSDEVPNYPLRNRGSLQSATQAANGTYPYYGSKPISDFSRVYSTIKVDSVSLFIMGKSETGTPFGARYNHRLATPLMWTQLSSFTGSMFNADTSASSIYTMGIKGTSLYLSKISKSAGSIMWNIERAPLNTGLYNPLDLKYNRIKRTFTATGYLADSTVTGNSRSYFYLTLDSSGNVIKDILRTGFGITESRVNSVDVLPNGVNIYGGAVGTAELGTVGFYNSDCSVSNVVPAVTISTPSTSFCGQGTPVTFTATALNTGLNPFYQWQINGANAGTNSTTFTTTNLNNNDQVKLVLTSNGSCLLTNTATSNIITITIGTSTTPTVTITSNATSICTGSTVMFTSTTANAGSSPSYQWLVNGINQGTNSPNFTSNTLQNGSQITMALTATTGCSTSTIVTSNVLSINVASLAPPVVTMNNNVLSVSNIDNGAVYIWQVLNNAIWSNIVPAATGPSFTTVQSGEYRVKAENSLCTTFSASVISNRNNVLDSSLYYINLSPNPATNLLTVNKIVPSQKWQSIDIINLQGARLLPSVNIKGLRSVTIDVSKLTAGIYFVRLTNEDDSKLTYRFLKK